MLHHLFRDSGDEMDEERIVRIRHRHPQYRRMEKYQSFSATVWWVPSTKAEPLWRLHHRADSVGLGKTTSKPWLKIIQITNCATTACWCWRPKRLRDNWTLYKANDKRNALAADQFNHGRAQPHRPVARWRNIR